MGGELNEPGVTTHGRSDTGSIVGMRSWTSISGCIYSTLRREGPMIS